MQFVNYLSVQLRKHPYMQPQDVVKLCYQAAFGSEHLLRECAYARNYLEKEYAELIASNEQLYEQISPTVSRINLATWKACALPLEWLFRMFVASCNVEPNGAVKFKEYLQAFDSCMNAASFSVDEWNSYLDEYAKYGMPAVHHSEQYRLNEHPAYRIVDSRFCRTLPILEQAMKYTNAATACIIAVDGKDALRIAALADSLQTILDADVIHMHDFFLPTTFSTDSKQNTAEGNIDYDGFKQELLPYLSDAKAFSYRVSDSSLNEMNITIDKPFRIVEGRYSQSQELGLYADILVSCDESRIDVVTAENACPILSPCL